MARTANAVIFDLDGTLIDSSLVMRSAFCTAFATVVGAGEPPFDEFLQLLGDSFPNILDRLGLPQAMAPAFSKASQDLIHEIRPVPAAIAACRKLADSSVPLAILTGKDRKRTLQIMRHFQIADLFVAVASGSDGFRPKPAPDGVLLLCDQMGCDVDDAVVVGDSVFDIQAATAAGATAVGCGWGMARPEALNAAGPHHLVSDPADLFAILEQLLASATGPDGTGKRRNAPVIDLP